MTRFSKLLVVTVLVTAIAAITAASAGANGRIADRSKVLSHTTVLHHANVGLPPVVGGPYGDPGDYPSGLGAAVRSDSSSDSSQSSGDDCLHQVVWPLTAC